MSRDVSQDSVSALWEARRSGSRRPSLNDGQLWLRELTSVQDWLGNTTNFAYDADSNPLTTTFPSATNETDTNAYNYDDALTGVTMKQGTSTLASVSLARYPVDLVQTNSQTGLPGPASDAYTYTQQQELASDNTSNYAYDNARNITELAGTSGYGYSTNGDSELTSGPAGQYSYNTLGERTALTPSSGPASGYSYNANQNLTQAIVPSGGSTATVGYSYNAAGQLQSSTTGGTTTTFTWDDTPSSPNLLAAGNEYYIYGPGGNAIEQISSGGTVQYLHVDQIGSTRLITSSTGAVAGTFTYSPYGALTGSTGTASSLLGYAGQYTDPTTKLVYDQARWYDPTTGQFMVVDPKVESTWQPYSYASDNPLSFTDPSGLDDVRGGEAGAAKLAAYCHSHSRSAVCGGVSAKDLAIVLLTVPLDEDGAGEEIDAAAIKAGSSGGPTAGKVFPQAVRQQALAENPSTCVYCHMETDSPQVDHSIARANGGNATIDNAQTTCAFCNASKGAREYPVNPPPGYEGPFPPSWCNSGGD